MHPPQKKKKNHYGLQHLLKELLKTNWELPNNKGKNICLDEMDLGFRGMEWGGIGAYMVGGGN